MSHSTSLDPQDISRQATRHETTAQNISEQLTQLKTNVIEVLNRSNSAATKALHMSTETWIESVRNSVLSHMNAMAENIRREANNQESMDQDNMSQILNVPLETGIFLGGSK